MVDYKLLNDSFRQSHCNFFSFDSINMNQNNINKEYCWLESLKFNTRTEFKFGSPRAYKLVRRSLYTYDTICITAFV
jgi:hypothetical protein